MHRYVVGGYGKVLHHLQVVGQTNDEGVVRRGLQRTIIVAQSVAQAVAPEIETDSGDQKTADRIIGDYPHFLRRWFQEAERVGSEVAPGSDFRESGFAAAGPVYRDCHSPALTQEFANQVGGRYLLTKADVGTYESGSAKARKLPAAIPYSQTSPPAFVG